MTKNIHTYKTMHQQEQKLQNMHQDSPFYQFHSKLIQLLISFSLLSILLSHPSWVPFYHSFISNFYTFSSHLFSLATDKNYIFLLCNGILVFIAKYSNHSAHTHPPYRPETSPDNELILYRQSMQSSVIEKSVMEEDEYENELQVNAVKPEDDVEDKYVVYQITDGTLTVTETETEEVFDEEEDDDDDEEYENKEFKGWSYEEQVEDEEEEEEDEEEEEEEMIADMNTEELNRKFDDFIRKMKEELRIEAQRQLIVV